MMNSTLQSAEPSQPAADSLAELEASYAGDPVFDIHLGGKMSIAATVSMETKDDLSLAYTPGVARVCLAIAENPAVFETHTWASRTVAVVTDGSAVLGLGNIGPKAAMPVMEGKAVLFKRFANVDAIPICLDTTDVDEIIETVVRLAPSFGGINLEDIAAPRCFEIEKALQERLDIPVFHDDQHGTAIVTLAALWNACRVTDRDFTSLRATISGAGAAGVAIANILLDAGIGDVVLVDSRGVLHTSRTDLNPVKAELAARTNATGITGSIVEALAGSDVLIGVSGGQIPEAAVAGMAPGGFIFAMANPTPEVAPDIAARYAAIVATGRSDFPNQINNVLAFPAVFKGAFDAGAKQITPAMKLAAAKALASVATDELDAQHVLPSPLDPRVVPIVSAAVAAAALDGTASV